MDRPLRSAIVGSVVAAAAMAALWRAQRWPEAFDPTDGSPWRPGGGMGMDHPVLPPATPLTLPALLAIGLTVAGILLLVRRPVPGYLTGVGGMVAYGALGGPSSGLLLPALVLAIGLLRRRGLAATAPWLAAIPLALWVTWWDRPVLGLADWRMWSGVISTTMWVLVPTLLVALVIQRHEERARERAEALERAASDERLRLAREIHDVVGHSLSMISLQSAVALRVLDADPVQARTSLEAIRSSSKDALTELRQTLGVFRGDPEVPLAPTPTVPAIQQLVDDVRRGGVRIDLAPLPDAAGLGAAVQAVAFRIVQESLTNALRHAPGHAVTVVVGRTPGVLTVRVADDGTASGPVTEGGGLRGMRERVQALGGTLAAGPTPHGFVVEATLPTAEGGR